MPLLTHNKHENDNFNDPWNPMGGSKRQSIQTRGRAFFLDIKNIALIGIALLVLVGPLVYLGYRIVQDIIGPPKTEWHSSSHSSHKSRISDDERERIGAEVTKRKRIEEAMRMAEEAEAEARAKAIAEAEMARAAEEAAAQALEGVDEDEIIVPKGVKIQFFVTPQKTDWVYILSSPPFEKTKEFEATVPDKIATELEKCMRKVRNKPIPKLTEVQIQLGYRGKKPELQKLTEDRYLTRSLNELQECMKRPISKLPNPFGNAKLEVTLDFTLMTVP
ncbi:MAG: hypothetical protein II767_10540 [Proteobacteria bacterium]|nr:hypothetical protein [Pseudomonadota bacterium]